MKLKMIWLKLKRGKKIKTERIINKNNQNIIINCKDNMNIDSDKKDIDSMNIDSDKKDTDNMNIDSDKERY
jgi:hypothetical protein